MAYRRGRYRRYRKYRRFYRRYKRPVSYARRYINASSRSQVRVRVSADMIWQTNARPSTGVVAITPLATGDATYGTSIALHSSALYRQYCALYDEAKIIGMKVNIATVTPVGTVTVPSLTFHTSWDRHKYYNEDLPTIDQLRANSSHMQTIALNNNVAKITRSIYASDLMEHATWFQTKINIGGQDSYHNAQYEHAGNNFQPFHPSLNWYVTVNGLADGTTVALTFAFSVVYYVAFRNPKYGGAGGGRATQLLDSVRGVTYEPDADDGDDVMMLPDADMDAAAAASASADVDTSGPGLLSKRQLSAASDQRHAGKAPKAKIIRVAPKNP